MNELIDIQNQEGQLVVSSRQVAEHFEKRHDHVLRTIESKIEDNPILGTPKYFIESSYITSQNKEAKEFLLTRDGFTFIVMGFTGSKADDWKLKYIEAFNKMEQSIKSQIPKLSPELQAIFQLDSRTVEMNSRISKLENTMTIDYSQQEEINTKARQRVLHILGGKDVPAYKELSKKAFAEIWRDYKRALDVNSYRNTAVKDFMKGLNFVTVWKPNRELELMIAGANAQMRV